MIYIWLFIAIFDFLQECLAVMPMISKILDFCKKKRWFAALVLVQVCFLLAHFALSMRVQAPLSFAGSELEVLSANATVADGSVTMTDNEDYGPFARTPQLSLKKGSYVATVTYESDLAGAKVFQDNDYVTMNEQVLDVGSGTASFTLWARGDTSTSFQFSYNGGTRTIYQFTVTPTHAYARVSSLGWLLFFAALDLLLLLRAGALPVCRAPYRDRLIYAGLIGLIVFQCMPLCAEFLFSGHDLPFHLCRIQGIADGLSTGQFPVKIYPSLLQGQGYANGVFYGDFFLYIPAVLRLIGFSLQSSYRLYVALVNLATVLISYWCFAKMFGDKLSGLLGAALYSLNLYRLTNLYTRAAVGEFSAMVFLPLILYALWAVFMLPTDAPGYKTLWLPGMIGYSGLILTHILTCGIAAIFTLLTCLVCIRKVFRKDTFIVLAKIVIYTTFICFWFLVPFADYMITDKLIVTVDTHSIFSTIGQSAFPLQVLSFFAPATGLGLELKEGVKNDMGFTLGGAVLLAGLILPLVSLQPGFKADKKTKAAGLCLGFGALCMWMSTTAFPWFELSRVVPFLDKFVSTMQFPWRFMSAAGLFVAVGAVAGFWLLRRKSGKAFLAVLSVIGVVVTCTVGYYFHDLYQSDSSYVIYEMSDVMANAKDTPYAKLTYQLGGAEYLPAGMDLDETWLMTNLQYNADDVRVTDYEKTGVTAQFTAENHTGSEQSVIVPLVGYRDYHASADGAALPLTRAENGQLLLTLPANFSGHVTITFTEPALWRAAEGISCVAVLALCAAGCVRLMRKNKLAAAV